MRAKRYVFEYARDVMRANEQRVRSGELRHPKADEILSVLRYCDRGLLTSREAVRSITEIDVSAREMTWSVATQGGNMA